MFFFNIRHQTNKNLVKTLRVLAYIKCRVVRPVVSFIFFFGYFIFIFKKNERTFSGNKLKSGISVYVPVKNEESWITPCLESLVGIADQFIIIDNGSSDQTWTKIQEFKEKNKTIINIIAIQRPTALLVEIVQEALSYVDRQWVLKWDGDMIANQDVFLPFINKNLKGIKPKAFILPRFNFCGDLFHVRKGRNPVDAGEPFLRRFNNRFVFKEEFGRLEHAVIPIYYSLVYLKRKKPFSIHFSDLRPPFRIIERTIYLDWRETTNKFPHKENFKNYHDFKKLWLFHNFKSLDEHSIKFRAGRLVAEMVAPAVPDNYGIEKPVKFLQENFECNFEIEYQDGVPYIMHYHGDGEMKGYSPSKEDLQWMPNPDDYYNDHKRLSFIHERDGNNQE